MSELILFHNNNIMTNTPEQAQNLFACASVEDITIHEGSDFFKPDDGTQKIRFLMGPIRYYEAQEFDEETRKPVGERCFYAEDDKAAKTNKFSNFTLIYMIYDYKNKAVKQWSIAGKGLLKKLKSINELYPDIAMMDFNLSKVKGSNGFNEYDLVPGPASAFNIPEVIEQFTNDNPYTKVEEIVATKIAETKAGGSIALEEKQIQDEIEMNKAMEATPVAKTVAPTPAPIVETPAPEVQNTVTPEEAKAAFK